MKTVHVIVPILGALLLGACKAPEVAGRSDTGGFHYSMSATRDDRELHQSLTAVSMKNDIGPGESLVISERARRLIADYAN